MIASLTCYGLTRAALDVLMPGPHSDIPQGWFQWTGPRAPGAGAFNPQRLQFLPSDEKAMKSLVAWNRNARAAGYACHLVASADEIGLVDGAAELDPQTRCVFVSRAAEDAAERRDVLDVLREPETGLASAWNDVTLGGGFVDERLAQVPPAHWWACGQGLEEWVRDTASGAAHAGVRRNTPDFSRWSTVALDIDWCWDVAKPWTAESIPALRMSGADAYFPIRALPCCGVVRHWDGSLATCGALPDVKDAAGRWLWDANGTLAKQLRATAVQKSFAEWLSAAFAPLGVCEIQPAAGRAASDDPGSRRVPFGDPRDYLEVEWSADQCVVKPMRWSGFRGPLWLSAWCKQADRAGARMLWCHEIGEHTRSFESGIDVDELVFVVTGNRPGENA